MDLFENVPELQSGKYRLQLLTANDIPLMEHFADSDPEIWRYALKPVTNATEMNAYLTEALNDLQQRKALPFIVIDTDTDSIVGASRLYELKPAHRSALLGYTWYSSSYHGSGINAHCKWALLQFAFEQLNLERVEFRADARNLHSLAAMRKLGCIEEGRLRNHLPVADGTRRDTVILSILRNEWYASVKPQLIQRIERLK